MRLFNKTIDRQLFKQYALGSDLSKQEVVVKIFNPQGAGSWYILNSDPQDPDYLWAIVDLGYGAEVGSVSRSDLETYRGRFGLGFERDLGFDPINAEELYQGLRNGEYYADGGNVQGKDTWQNIFEEFGFKKGRSKYGLDMYYKRGYVGSVDHELRNVDLMYEEDVIYRGFSVQGLLNALENQFGKRNFADGGEIEVVYERSLGSKKPIKMLLLSKGREQKGYTFSGKDQVAVLDNYNRNKQEDLERLWNLKGYETKYADGGQMAIGGEVKDIKGKILGTILKESKTKGFENKPDNNKVLRLIKRSGSSESYGVQIGRMIYPSENINEAEEEFKLLQQGYKNNFADGGEISGDEVTLSKGYGYYDLSKYAYGNDFKRFVEPVNGKFIKGTVKLGGQIRVLLNDGREIITDIKAIDLPTYDEKNELYQQNKHLFSFGYADGGNISDFTDNQQMIMNQNVELEHHHEELEDILEDKVPVPAWVVAKMATATQSISDVTHYLDGEKELMEDEIEDENEEEDEEENEDEDEIGNKEVVEPINVSAETKAEMTKKFTDDAMGNLKGFLKGMEGIELRDDYTFDYKDEQFEIEPIINSDENGVSNAVFTFFDGDGEEVGEVAYSREGGKQKFTANSQFFGWDRAKFEDGGFMNGVYDDGGRVYDGVVDYKKASKLLMQYKPEILYYSDGYVFVDGIGLALGSLTNQFKGYGDSTDIKNLIYKVTHAPFDKAKANIEKFTKGEYTLTKGGYGNQQHFLKTTKKLSDGGYFDGTIPKVSTYMTNYAKGGKVDSFIPNVGSIDTFMLKSMLIKNSDVKSILSDKEFEFLKNENTDAIGVSGKPFNTIITDGNQEIEFDLKKNVVVKHLTEARDKIKSHYSINFAKGGEIAKAEIFGLKRNIMGTTDIEMRISGMRKAQDFIVYPIGADDARSVITIQSGTRIGQINLVKGVGVMSQSHSSGAYFVHLQMDKLTPFTISESDLENLKAFINKTSGSSVGSSIVKSDNSGASGVYDGGGSVDYVNQYFGKGFEDESIVELKKALPNHTFEKGKNSIIIDGGKFIIHLDFGKYGFIRSYSDEGAEGGHTVQKIDEAISFINENNNNYAKGGVTYFNNENQHRLSRPSGSFEKEIYAKVKDRIESDSFVGSFGWKILSNKKSNIADGFLYKLDDYDQNLIKNLNLKQGEKVFRYVNRTTAIGGMMPFIKINIEKALLYFPVSNDNDDIIFETRGVTPLWINLIQGSFADGGEVYSHKHSKGWGEDITIELLEPTAKGWKVKQTTKKGRKTSTKTTFFSKQEISELFEKQYSDGGEVTNETYEKRLQYLKMMKNNERTDLGKFRIDKEIREINTILEHRNNLKSSYAKGGNIKLGDIVEVKEPNYGYDSNYYVVDNKAGYDKDGFLISETSKRLGDVFEEDQLHKIYADGGFMDNVYADGGNLKKYILKADIKTVTVKRNGKEVTYKGTDVLNGANVLAKGGDLTSKANYIPKRDVVSVELKDGTTVKPVNGYWVKKGAEPIESKQVFTSKDLPKDGSSISINAPAMSGAPAIDLVLKYDSKNFRFDVYKDGVKKDVIGEKEVLINLNNGIYVFSDKPTPTSSSKSATKVGETYIKKGAYGWSATTNIDDFNNYDWRISTFKTSNGQLLTSAKGGKSEDGDGYTTFKYMMYEDPYHTLEVSKPSRLTDKVVAEQHAKGLAKFKKFMETGMFRGGGKISNFDKLSDKVAKQYEGKPVKNQYQEEYGKYYSREEAQEVGDKVAGKVKAMQTDKKAFGGLFKNVKNLAKAKPKYPNLEGKQVPLKSGEFVMIFTQDENTLSVMNVGKIGSGVKLRNIDISEVDMTNFKAGGQTGTKKMNAGAETMKQANDLAKKIRMNGESWLDARKRAFAELRKQKEA